MNQTEAQTLVGMLVTSFPGARFDSTNATAYEAAIADLEARETQDALAELVRTFTPTSFAPVPPISAIRSEVARIRKARHEADNEARRRLSAHVPSDGPSKEMWVRSLRPMLDAGERYRAMAERWYQERGKRYPGDPSRAFVELVAAGARGEDVRERFRREVLPQ